MRTPNQGVTPSDCRIETTPQQNRSAEIRKATSSGGSCSARPMISGTAMAPAYMTSTCCRPSVKSFGAGSISSTGWMAVAMRRVSRLGGRRPCRCGGGGKPPAHRFGRGARIVTATAPTCPYREAREAPSRFERKVRAGGRGCRRVGAGLAQILLLRHPHDQPVEVVGDPQLAGQPALRRVGLPGEVEHVLLHRLPRRQPVDPGGVDVDVAGRAGAGAAAVGLDAGDAVVARALHHRQTGRHLDLVRGAVELDVGDLRHAFASRTCPPAI